MREELVAPGRERLVSVAAAVRNPLIPAGLLALIIAAVLAALFLSIGSALAHHNTYSATVNCAGDWSAVANYVGGDSRRLLVISDVKINGVDYHPSWSTDAGDSSPFGNSSIVAYSLSASDFDAGEAPGGTPDYMWDGTDNGWSIFNRTGTGNFTNAPGTWTGTLYLYERSGGKWSKVDTDNITAPTQPTNCGTIIVKKVIQGGGHASQQFTVDIDQISGSTYDFNNLPFSVNSPVSKTVLANGSQDYDVTEDSPPSGFVFVGKYSAAGDVACPASTSGSWTITSDRKVDVDNMPAGGTKTVCFLNAPTQGTIIIKKVLRGGDPNQPFTADINQVGGSASDFSDVPFSVNSAATRTVFANGSEDYTVTEDAPPSGYSFVGKKLLNGDAACPSSTSNDWTFTTNRTVEIDNLAVGATKTVCFLNEVPCIGAADSYQASLTSPTVPNASDTFTWQISGQKPGPGCEISHIEISGCWEKDDIKSVTATGAGGAIPSGDIEIKNDGTVKVDELQDSDLPLNVTIVFFSTYTSGNNLATVFIKTGGGANVGVSILVGGPTCETPRGAITVCKEVVPPTDPSEWDFTLSGPTPGTAEDLGDGDCHTWQNRDAGSYTITETTAAGYKTTVECTVQHTAGSGSVSFTLAAGGSVTCTFTNTKLGKITVCKDVVPDDGETTEWDVDLYNAAGAKIGTAQDLVDEGDCHTFDGLAPGTYYLDEVTKPGYETAVECDNNTSEDGDRIEIDLGAGEHVKCTFTNTSTAKITVCKDVVPDDDGATLWDFGVTGGPAQVNLQANDLGDGDCFTFEPLAPGDYSVYEEMGPAGYEMAVECDNGSTDGDFELEAGEHVTCVFTNTAKARITVCKNVEPDDDSLWDFNLTGQSPATDLEDEGDCHTWQDLLPGQYTLSEVTQPGYDESVSCDNGQSSNTANIYIDLRPGDDITCTFLNEHAKITVCKEVLPESDQNTWTFNVSGPTGEFETGELGDGDCESFSPLEAGEYVVSEDVESGYAIEVECDNEASGVAVTKFMLERRDHVTCTFINTKLGSITVCKETDPDDSPESFPFTGTSPIGDFELGDGDCDTTVNLAAGDYSITETVLGGWELTDIDCGSADVTEAAPTVTVHLGIGEDVTCTFYNTQDGSIEVCKETDPDGREISFDFELDGSFLASLEDDECSTADLAPGTYEVSEDVPLGWELTDIDCEPAADGTIANGVTINLGAGEHVSCTFYNREFGTITICKETDPDASQKVFEFSGSLGDFQLADGDCETFGDLEPGGYSVDEDVPAGWELIEIDCGKADAASGETGVELELHAGEAVTCTFYNQERGTIVICKQTVPEESGGTFDFTGDLGEFSLNQGDCRKFSDLEPYNTYDVSEMVPEGWVLTNVVCQGGDAGSIQDGVSIDLGPGETVTCTFVNSAPGTVTIIKLTQPASDNSTGFNFTGSFGPFPLVGNNSSTTFTNVLAGNYTVNETPTPGWELIAIDCGSANAVISATGATFDVPNGGAVTCVFTNRQDSSLTIVKETIPDGSPRTFDFTGDIGNFTLSDGQSEVADPIPPGIYRIDEIVPPGWALTGVDCLGPAVDDATGVTVNISPGEDEVCTFTNEELPTPTPSPTPSPTPTPTPSPTPTPTPSPTPTGTIIETPPPPTETPVETPIATPTPTPTVQPTVEPTPPPPTEEPTPGPTLEPTPAPTVAPTPEPTVETTPEPSPATPTPPVAEATQTPQPTQLPAVFPPTGGSAGTANQGFTLLLLVGGAAFILGTILIAGGIRRQDR